MTKVLYVEDEPFLAKIVKETLEMKSYEVFHVADGAKVISVFKSKDFDICILDIMLPHKSGYDIALELSIYNPDIPILFLTAKTQTEDVIKGFRSGGNDYIKKPFSIEELIVRMENLMLLKSQQNKMEVSEFIIGNKYTFYPKKFELNSIQDSRNLSHKETLILELLCQNMNQVTHRKDILFKVWNDDSFYNSRNLDVYITKLRSYFKLDPNTKIITLKGVGYQFSVQ